MSSRTLPYLWDIRHVDQAQLSHPLLELPQASVHEFLPLLGHVVLAFSLKSPIATAFLISWGRSTVSSRSSVAISSNTSFLWLRAFLDLDSVD